MIKRLWWLGLLVVTGCASLENRLTEAWGADEFFTRTAAKLVVLEFREGGLNFETDWARQVRLKVQELLARSKNLTLVANDQELRTIYKAQDAQLTPLFDANNIVRMGNLVGADYALAGELQELTAGQFSLQLKLFSLEKGTVAFIKNLTFSQADLPSPRGFVFSRFPTEAFLQDMDNLLPALRQAWTAAQPPKGPVQPLFAAQINPRFKRQTPAESLLQNRLLGQLGSEISLRSDVLGGGYNFASLDQVWSDLATPVYAKANYLVLATSLEEQDRVLTYRVSLIQQKTRQVLQAWTLTCENNRSFADYNQATRLP